MAEFPGLFTRRLDQRKEQFGFRSLGPRRGIDFSSNDYLGFASDQALAHGIFDSVGATVAEVSVNEQANHQSLASPGYARFESGSTASRLLRGNTQHFDRVEMELADFCGTEQALIFPSGYQCNLGVLSAIASPGDLVFSDFLNHASLIDGIRLSRAKKVIYPHNNLDALRSLLIENRDFSGLKFIVTESIFSMDGDHAPLAELCELANEHAALIIVDEAHATGLWGGKGGGRVQELGLRSQVFASVHSGGKALGVGGAWVACSAQLKEFLVNESRPFIYSTAPPPIVVESLSQAVRHWSVVGRDRSITLRNHFQYLRGLLTDSGFLRDDVLAHLYGPIMPIIVGENERALQLAQKIQAEGLDVRAIRPPTVPDHTSRIRVALHWQNTHEQMEQLASLILKYFPSDHTAPLKPGGLRSAQRLGYSFSEPKVPDSVQRGTP